MRALPTHVSFEGAGTRGMSYLGFLDALEDHLEAQCGQSFDAWRQSLQGVAGTSAGSLVALVLILGLDRTARHELLQEISDMRALLRCPDIGRLVRHFGWEDGTAFKEMVQHCLMRGGLSAQSTLADLKRLLRVDFVCMCTHLATGTEYALSSAATPRVLVCDALYASCCVPFLFSPPIIDGHLVVDGSLSCDLPDVFPDDDTLFVRVRARHDAAAHGVRMDTWSDFLHGIVGCSIQAQEIKKQAIAARCGRDRLWSLVIPASVNARTCAFDVDVSPDIVEDLVRCGYVSVLHTLTEGRLFADVGALVVHLIGAWSDCVAASCGAASCGAATTNAASCSSSSSSCSSATRPSTGREEIFACEASSGAT